MIYDEKDIPKHLTDQDRHFVKQTLRLINTATMAIEEAYTYSGAIEDEPTREKLESFIDYLLH